MDIRGGGYLHSYWDIRMTKEHYDAGFEVGLLNLHIMDDWYIEGVPYPSDYARGWDAGNLIWWRSHCYWGA